jgi:type VI secretion system protein ImpG
MNPKWLEYYNKELQFIREMGAVFAKQHPDKAANLDLGREQCADPYVERLLEGFAFLTARIHLKMDAEFPRFTQNLLEMVYPHYLAPLPSMTIVQFKPDIKGGVPEVGFILPKQTRLEATNGIRGRAKCEFRTAHDLTLWPLQLTQAAYLPLNEAVKYADSDQSGIKSAIRLRLETLIDMPINKLSIDRLPVYLHGSSDVPLKLYELIFGRCISVKIQAIKQNQATDQIKKISNAIHSLGFDPENALLPYPPSSFQGYRLLQEYFALPERFMFFELNNLQSALKEFSETSIDVIILFNEAKPELVDRVSKDNFALYCTPAINLFPKWSDRVLLNQRSAEYQLIIDKTAQSDFEVHSVTEVVGYGSGASDEQIFHPFYNYRQENGAADNYAYYTIRREPDNASASSNPEKSKDYLGSEVFISLVDSSETPFRSDLKQLGIKVLCTNRDLPILFLIGEGNSDFSLEISAPVDEVRCLVRPTKPKPSHAEGEYAWRLISHLSLNYLSLIDDKGSNQGAKALRELLRLYADLNEPTLAKQIEGLLNVKSNPVVLRVPVNGPMCFGRGVEISVTFDEVEGSFLLGAVLEKFICKYVSINSFTQVVINTRKQGEIMRWPVRTGTRTLI